MSKLGNQPHVRIYMGNDGKYTWRSEVGHGFARGLPSWKEGVAASRFVADLNDRREAKRVDVLAAWEDLIVTSIANATGLTKEQILSPVEVMTEEEESYVVHGVHFTHVVKP